MLVRLPRCGVDGTGKEINGGKYGAAPPGYDLLVTGHENFGQMEAVGTSIARFGEKEREGPRTPLVIY